MEVVGVPRGSGRGFITREMGELPKGRREHRGSGPGRK